jgi:hypothetical protein
MQRSGLSIRLVVQMDIRNCPAPLVDVHHFVHFQGDVGDVV